jgi:hypothetical protein
MLSFHIDMSPTSETRGVSLGIVLGKSYNAVLTFTLEKLVPYVCSVELIFVQPLAATGDRDDSRGRV